MTQTRLPHEDLITIPPLPSPLPQDWTGDEGYGKPGDPDCTQKIHSGSGLGKIKKAE